MVISDQEKVLIGVRIEPELSGHSRNYDIPEKAGIEKFKDRIPPYQVRGRLSQARNDKKNEQFIGGSIDDFIV